MAKAQKRIPADKATLERLVSEAGSIAELARQLNVPRRTLSDHLNRHGIKRQPQHDQTTTLTDSQIRHINADITELGDVAALLKRRGLNPDQWIISRVRVNEWGTADNQANQLRIDLLPRELLPEPIVKPTGWQPPTPGTGTKTTTGLTLYTGDHHAPHHDPELHQAVLAWINDHKPERIIILGDLLDYDRISRHAPNPVWSATLAETLEAGYDIVAGYRNAAGPTCQIEYLDGNHEDRLRIRILDKIPSLHGLKRANATDNDPPLLSTPSLLCFDELNINYCDSPNGPYDSAQIKINENLAARHGWIARKGSGASALSTIDHLRYSVIIGHCHRQAIVYHTAHDIDGNPKRLLGCEAGTLARIEGGLGYVQGGAPDWQQGFATSTTHDDGTFTVELAVYAAGSLLWRDWQYRP